MTAPKIVTDELTMYAQTVAELRAQNAMLIKLLNDTRPFVVDRFALRRINDALKEARE